MQEAADALLALFRGDESEDAELGALVLADAVDEIRHLRRSMTRR